MNNRSDKTILLAHGSGGRLTHELISSFIKRFSNPALNALDDAACLALPSRGERIAFTTDGFVVNPLFFPGGDIGKLAVCGTVNDLAMKGARPRWISVSAVIEEGLDCRTLDAVMESLARTARAAGVCIVAGDTKVVERGKADRLFLTTSGIGVIPRGIDIAAANARPGDTVLINGTIGDHGTAVLAARNDFKLTSSVKSDCAPLGGLVARMLAASPSIHVLRDPTRGGLATTLNEIAASARVGIIIEEKDIPVQKSVRAACNILGLDPLYVANEGKLIAIAESRSSAKILAAMKRDPLGKRAVPIGRVVRKPHGVWLKTRSGGLRPLVMLEGDQLPRIC